MMRLTFDWDGVSIQDALVQSGLAKLSEDFPTYDIYYRISSSQTGIHAIVSPPNSQTPTPIEMDSEDALNYRKQMVSFGLEDEWRLKGDIVRVNRGLPTSQLWEWKDGKQAGEWVKYNVE